MAKNNSNRDEPVYSIKLGKKAAQNTAAELQRQRQLNQKAMSAGQQVRMQVLALKYRMEDQTHAGTGLEFGSFLKAYAKIIGRKNYELAADIGLNETRLSQIMTGRILPNEKLVYRLELHSGQLLPAAAWLAVLERDIEYKIQHDAKTRRAEYKQVKKMVVLDSGVVFAAAKTAVKALMANKGKVVYQAKPKVVAKKSAVVKRVEKGEKILGG